MKYWLIYFISLFIIFIGCKKRDRAIQWDADFSLPLAYGSLNIVDILSDTLTNVQADQSVNLSYSSTLYSLHLDSLVDISSPDLSDTFALPFPVAVNFNPGQFFINQAEEQNIDLNSVELTEFDLESATLNYTLKSTIIGEVIYEYQINSATDQLGNIFSHEVLVPAAQTGQPAIVNGSVTLTNYHWDLTGISGNKTNTILTTINVKVSENNTAPISVSDQDTLYIQNNLTSFQIKSARGYFGQDIINVGPEAMPIDLFNKIISGTIDISQLTTNFEMVNGIGADAQIQLNGLSVNEPITGNPINLGHTIIGQTININRAYENGSSVIPSIYSNTFDQSNSNIVTMLEAIPDQINYNMQIQINPLGNVSAHNDFVHKNYPFEVNMDILMPLDLIANNLTLQDTIHINIPDTSGINYGSLYIEIDNGFPFNAQLILSLENGNTDLLSPNIINTAITDINGLVSSSSSSTHTLDLSATDIELLKSNKEIILTIVFNTADPNNYLTIYDHYELDFKISGHFNATVNIP